MGLETGTYINDLVVTNPTGTDLKTQGDDHLRLIKSVLKTTFPRASRPNRFPLVVGATSNTLVAATDDNTLFLCNTGSGSFTITLPVLAVGDAGWFIEVMKNDLSANPVFIAPPSGTINGFSKIRRTMEFLITKIIWTGASFYAHRPNGGAIGSSRHFYGTALPNDCLWADGTTFLAADFVELNSVLGGNTKPDIRGRAEFGKDNAGGSTAGRITGAGFNFDGTVLGATGGLQFHTLTKAELPATPPTGILGGSQTFLADIGGEAHGGGGGGFNTNFAINQSITIFGASFGFFGDNLGSGQAHSILPPAIIANVGIVAE